MKYINLLLAPLFVWVSVHCHYQQDVCDKLNSLTKEGVESAKIVKPYEGPIGYTLFYDDQYLGAQKEFELGEVK